jgi:hypothetical protein
VLILVRNDLGAPRVCMGDARSPGASSPFLSEVLSPILTMLNTRTARGRLAEEDAVAYVNARVGDAPLCEKGCVLEFALSEASAATGAVPDPKKPAAPRRATADPPLGWSLSVASQEAMTAQLTAHAEQFRCLRELAATGRAGSALPVEPRTVSPGLPTTWLTALCKFRLLSPVVFPVGTPLACRLARGAGRRPSRH